MAKSSSTKASTPSATDSLLGTTTPEELAELMKEGVQSAEVCSLEIGQSFRGSLVGRGQEVETTDSVTGEPKQLQTWRFIHPTGATVDILSCHQLEKDLKPLEGQNDVFIMRMAKKDIGGKQVNQYKVIHFPTKKN